jgi:hypothetical protein
VDNEIALARKIYISKLKPVKDIEGLINIIIKKSIASKKHYSCEFSAINLENYFFQTTASMTK